MSTKTVTEVIAEQQACIDRLRENIAGLLNALHEIEEEVIDDVDTDFNDRPNQAARICNIIDRALGRIP